MALSVADRPETARRDELLPSSDPLRRLCFGVALAVIAIGASVLFGWAIESEWLKSPAPGLSETKANTALCFVLSGASLAFGRIGSGRRFAAGRVLAILVGAIAVATLSEYLFGWNLGLDEMLFHDSSSSVATLSPGRMGANTAFNFTLVSLALLTVDVEWRGFRPTQACALIVAVLGYAYGVSTLSTSFITEHITPMALHTALTFIVLAVGLMPARPERGMMVQARSAGPGGQLVRRLLLPVVLIPR